MKDIALALGLPEDASDKEIIKAVKALLKTAEKLAAAETQIEELKLAAKKIPKGIDEKVLAEKIKAGLTKEQAIEVMQRQAEEDAKSKASK